MFNEDELLNESLVLHKGDNRIIHAGLEDVTEDDIKSFMKTTQKRAVVEVDNVILQQIFPFKFKIMMSMNGKGARWNVNVRQKDDGSWTANSPFYNIFQTNGGEWIEYTQMKYTGDNKIDRQIAHGIDAVAIDIAKKYLGNYTPKHHDKPENRGCDNCRWKRRSWVTMKTDTTSEEVPITHCGITGRILDNQIRELRDFMKSHKLGQVIEKSRGKVVVRYQDAPITQDQRDMFQNILRDEGHGCKYHTYFFSTDNDLIEQTPEAGHIYWDEDYRAVLPDVVFRCKKAIKDRVEVLNKIKKFIDNNGLHFDYITFINLVLEDEQAIKELIKDVADDQEEYQDVKRELEGYKFELQSGISYKNQYNDSKEVELNQEARFSTDRDDIYRFLESIGIECNREYGEYILPFEEELRNVNPKDILFISKNLGKELSLNADKIRKLANVLMKARFNINLSA